MQVLSINSGKTTTLGSGERTFQSAIYKQPVTGPVRIGRLGVRGDQQADTANHGGPEMAVHLFPFEHYSFWSMRFGHTMYSHGRFGENLTTSGILENDLCLGDRLRVGQALLQVTMPRTPCFKIEAVMSVRGFAALMAASGRVGCYLRVLEEGLAEAGQPLVFESRDPEHVSVHEAFNIIVGRNVTRELLERAASVHSLSPKLKGRIDSLFAKTDETR